MGSEVFATRRLMQVTQSCPYGSRVVSAHLLETAESRAFVTGGERSSLCELIEHEDDCRGASREDDNSERRETSCYEPKPPGSKSPSESE